MRCSATVVACLVMLGASGWVGAEKPPRPEPESRKSERVRIFRDDYGTPHVLARNPRGLFFGFGYAVAQDRLWQAEINRRMALGTLAEVFGPSALPSDVFARRFFGPFQLRAEMLTGADDWTRTILSAYASGINAWIDKASDEGLLPLEFAAFGVEPTKWSEDDVVASFIALNAQLSWVPPAELENAQALESLISRLGPEEGLAVFADTHWLDDPSAPTTIPVDRDIMGLAELVSKGRQTAALRTAVNREDIRRWARVGTEVTAFLREVQASRNALGLPRGPSSFALALGPRLTEDGSAVLIGGPQAGFSVPGLALEIGLHGAGFNAVGVSVAGAPFLAAGAGRRVAWSLTTAGTDHWDVFAEVVDPADPDRYQYNGDLLSFGCRLEIFRVAAQDDMTMDLCESVHGPVLFRDSSVAFALANSVRGLGLNSLSGWSRLGTARSHRQFGSLVKTIDYNINHLYADADGNIAFWQTGLIPVRAPGVDPWLPTLGTGQFDWQGFMPREELPSALNPSQGWMANWNSKPRADWPNSNGGFFAWGPVQRVQRIIQLSRELGSRDSGRKELEELVEEIGQVVDTPSGQPLFVFAPGLLKAMTAKVVESTDPRLPGVVDRLLRWADDGLLQTDEDGDGFFDQPDVSIFNTWYTVAVEQILRDEVGAIFDETRGGLAIFAQLLHRLLDPNPALWLQADYLDGRTTEEAITRALIDSLDQLTARYQSEDLDDWLQPALEIEWQPGGLGTVPNSPYGNRGIYTQIVRLRPNSRGGRVGGVNNLPPGQSGDFRSPHFADQIEDFNRYDYKEMRLNVSKLWPHIESTETIRVE